MNNDPFTKQPAFFPFVSAEIFFEAEANAEAGTAKVDTLDVDLDAELDEILSTQSFAEKEVA